MKQKMEIQVNLAKPWKAVNGHAVAPVVIVREGVHCGSVGCVFHPAEPLQGLAKQFNNIPVVLNHPKNSSGKYVSVYDGTATNLVVLGRVKNSKWDEKRKAITADLELKLTGNGASEARNCKEVSMGVYCTEVEAYGQWNGEHYIARAVSYEPDHVAVLTDEPGACSWADGCGIRANELQNEDIEPMLPPGVK